MIDRLAIPPTHTVSIGNAAICGDHTHLFDGVVWGLVCPCGSAGVWLNEGVLDRHIREYEERRPGLETDLAAHELAVQGLRMMARAVGIGQ